MLFALSRAMVWLLAALYTLLGLPLFFAPGLLATNFAWKVSPFVTMTIGAWCLGNAWLAATSAWRGQWRLIYTPLLYLGLFGLFELAVVVAFRAKLVLTSPMAWLYLVTLGVNAAAAALWALEWLRRRPALIAFGPSPSALDRAFVAAFVLFVGCLAAYGLVAPVGAPGTNGGIFPEVMSPFTLRSFAAFYLSLALAATPLLWERATAPGLHHAFASYGLIVIITVAAMVFIGQFDFLARPGGLVYFGAYLVVGIPLLFIFLVRGTGTRGPRPPV